MKANATYGNLDPGLEAIWNTTPTFARYVIDGERHILGDVHNGRRTLVPLAEAGQGKLNTDKVFS